MATKRVPSISPVPSRVAGKALRLNIKCCSRSPRSSCNRTQTLSAATTQVSNTTRLPMRHIRRSCRARSNSITTFKTKKSKLRALNKSRTSETSDRARITAIPASAMCTLRCPKHMPYRASRSKRSRRRQPTRTIQTLKKHQISAQFCNLWQTYQELTPLTLWAIESKRCGCTWKICWVTCRSSQLTST